MSIEIISKRIIALALGTILAVGAWRVVATQQTASTPVARLPEVKEPAAVGLTVDMLKAMMVGAEASKDLSETDKKSVISYLEAGVRLLEETDVLNAEAQNITEAVTAAPQRDLHIRSVDESLGSILTPSEGQRSDLVVDPRNEKNEEDEKDQRT